MSADSFLHPYFLQESMPWCSDLSMFRKFLKPLSTSTLPSCRPGRCDVCCAYQFVCQFIPSDSLGSRFTEVFAARDCACQSGGIPSKTPLLQHVHWVCENDGMHYLCVRLVDQPPYCLCDYLYLRGQTGGCDSVGTTTVMYSPSTLPQMAQSQGTGLVGGSQSSRVEGLCTKTVEPTESRLLAWPWR